MVNPPVAVKNRVSETVGQIEVPVHAHRFVRRKLFGCESCPLHINFGAREK